MSFKALIVSETNHGKFERTIVNREINDLPSNEVLIRVLFSSLNYKDALSATGNKGITRNFPHTPGIDAAGIVEFSSNTTFTKGDEVIVTGYDLGMNTPGGFGEYIKVPWDWIIKKPKALSLKDSMVIGTAGFTAAVALHKLEGVSITPGSGKIIVTGSTGGVGSLAVSLLSKCGYEVVAITGKKDATAYLKSLGASEIKERQYVYDTSEKPLIKSRWAGGIDTLGGKTLETLLKGCSNEGAIVSTGLVASPQLHTTVYPFILNGVSLLGVGSAGAPMDLRVSIWERLAGKWNITDKFSMIAKEVSLEELNEKWIDTILEGKVIGRIVIKH